MVHSLPGPFSVLASFLFVTNHVVARESRRVTILASSANSVGKFWVNRHLAESLDLGSRASKGCPDLRVILFAKEIFQRLHTVPCTGAELDDAVPSPRKLLQSTERLEPLAIDGPRLPTTLLWPLAANASCQAISYRLARRFAARSRRHAYL